MASRSLRKKLHKNGTYPKVYPSVFTRRKLGDPPGFYGKMERFIKPAQLDAPQYRY